MTEQDRERLARVEEQSGTVREALADIKQVILDLANELRSTYVPRVELETRFQAIQTRLDGKNARLTLLENKPNPPHVPPWVAVIVACFGTVLGALITLILMYKGVK